MNRFRNAAVLAVAMASVASTYAHAVPISALSYDMLNGNTGTYQYWDEIYVGASPVANNTINNAPLFGGKGDLTDGIIAPANWNVTEAPAGNGPYVGWTLDPTITFHFAAGSTVNLITFYLDDANGFGGVSAPASIDVNGTNYVVAEPPGSAPFSFSVAGLSLDGSFDVTLNRNNLWVFLSEVSFDGTLNGGVHIPEPTTLALFGAGLAGLALVRRRRRAKT